MYYLNFKISELIKSDTARKNHISNIPSEPIILDNLLNLITGVLQPVRDLLGKPIIITSGYRCDRLNRLVGGVKSSGHKQGRCADIKVNGMSAKELYEYIKNNNFNYRQLILEKNQWVHIDYARNDLKKENLKYDGKSYIKDL